MTIVTFVLGLVLIAAGAGGLAASYDLLPTELGLLYACCGAILVSGGVVTVAIGVAVLRLEALTQMVHFAAAVEDLPEEAEVVAALQAARGDAQLVGARTRGGAGRIGSRDGGRRDARRRSAGGRRARGCSSAGRGSAARRAGRGCCGRRPAERRRARAGAPAAAAQPTLVGHYSAGGANYKIFSDGSIEAETDGGAFRFASMDDFKAYLASARA